MAIKYVLMIVSYAVLGGLALRLVAQEHPEPAAALTFTGVWLVGFVWISAYALAGKDHANYFTKLVAGLAAGMAAFGAVVWFVMDLLD
jgi:hypothetical protein